MTSEIPPHQNKSKREGNGEKKGDQKPTRRRLRRIIWGTIGVVVLLIAGLVAWYVIPIVTHQSGGSSGEVPVASGTFPSSVTATGQDGLTRSLTATAEDGGSIDLGALTDGARVVVSGSGYDEGTGIYVAICAIPASPDIKPSPCLGGVPEVSEGQTIAAWSSMYWINDSAQWQLFGAKSYGSGGSFTVQLSVPATDGSLDCRTTSCAIYTRADHTAVSDRVQDLWLPIRFAN